VSSPEKRKNSPPPHTHFNKLKKNQIFITPSSGGRVPFYSFSPPYPNLQEKDGFTAEEGRPVFSPRGWRITRPSLLDQMDLMKGHPLFSKRLRFMEAGLPLFSFFDKKIW